MNRTRPMLALLAGAALGLLPAAAGAEPGYDAHVWQPAQDGSGLFTTWGSGTIPQYEFRFGAAVDYARNPVVLSAGGSQPIAAIIDRATTMEMAGYFGLPYELEAGVVVPMGLRGYPNPYGADRDGGVAANGFGDVRTEVKWRAMAPAPERYIPGVAIVGTLALPTGDGRSWLGTGTTQPSLLLVGEEHLGPVSILANLGYRFHPGQESVYAHRVDDAFIYRAGAAWRTGWQELTVLTEGTGFTTLGGGPSPFEAGLGLRRPVYGGLSASVGANLGFGQALGTPAWRTFLTLSWGPAPGEIPEPPPSARVYRMDEVPIAPEYGKKPQPVTPVPLAEPAAPQPKPVPKAEIQREEIVINDTIHFEKNSYVIDSGSFPILNEVARVMKEHAAIEKLSIDGHTDSTGNSVLNLLISKLRANAVLKYLVAQGIEEGRLETQGYGESRPVATNRSKDGRAMNRRVEFRILKHTDADTHDHEDEATPATP